MDVRSPHHVRRRADWDAIEAAYVRGTEVHGEHRFPSLDDVALHFAVSRRQAAYHSRRRRWPQKRDAFRTELALEAHRGSLQRRLEENEKLDDITLKVAKFAIGKVVAALNDLQQLSVPAPASLLETLVRTTERAQKIAKVAMSLPTELLEHKDRADAARRAAVDAPSDDGDPVLRLIAKVERLEGEEFLAAIDGLMGATPAGRGTVLRFNGRS